MNMKNWFIKIVSPYEWYVSFVGAVLLKDEFNYFFLHMININNSYPLKNNYNNICNLKNVSVYLK